MGWEKIFHANGNQRKAGVAILRSDKIDEDCDKGHRWALHNHQDYATSGNVN